MDARCARRGVCSYLRSAHFQGPCHYLGEVPPVRLAWGLGQDARDTPGANFGGGGKFAGTSGGGPTAKQCKRGAKFACTSPGPT